MRRLLFAVVAVGIMFGVGVSFAQDTQKPDHAMAKFKGMVGHWVYEGEQADPPMRYWNKSHNIVPKWPYKKSKQRQGKSKAPPKQVKHC